MAAAGLMCVCVRVCVGGGIERVEYGCRRAGVAGKRRGHMRCGCDAGSHY
jgi:hypothetical protein